MACGWTQGKATHLYAKVICRWRCQWVIPYIDSKACNDTNNWKAAIQALMLATLLVEEEEWCQAKRPSLWKSCLLLCHCTCFIIVCCSEVLAVLAHDWEKLCWWAMPNLETAACDQLLLHQFLAGLLAAVSWQLRTIGNHFQHYSIIYSRGAAPSQRHQTHWSPMTTAISGSIRRPASDQWSYLRATIQL